MRWTSFLMLLALAGGCTSTSETRTEASPVEGEDIAAGMTVCDLVDNAVIQTFAETDITSTTPGDYSGVPRCIYQLKSGGRVQTVSVESSTWADQLPDILELVERSQVISDAENLEKMDLMRERLKDGSSEGCELFSLLVELQGLPHGSVEVMNYVPDTEAPLAVNGQRCTDDLYSSIQLQEDGLFDDTATVDRVFGALSKLHEAGIQAAG